jgi:hypothetical protein
MEHVMRKYFNLQGELIRPGKFFPDSIFSPSSIPGNTLELYPERPVFEKPAERHSVGFFLLSSDKPKNL